MKTARIWLIALVAVVVAVGGVGCTDVSRSGSAAPGVTLPSPASPGRASSDRRSIAGSSAKDIAATLRANGVDDPEHWADVVIAHQPYPIDDTSLSKLRTELTREQAGSATADRIARLLAP